MTARVTTENYEAMKGFCLWFWEQQSGQWDQLNLRPDHRPDAVLKAFELKSMAVAREGVRQGIGDIIEETQDLGADELTRIDAELSARGLPTLTQVRLQFWGKIASIMRRGTVRTETEYCALRNVVDAMTDADRGKAWSVLGDFETRKAG